MPFRAEQMSCQFVQKMPSDRLEVPTGAWLSTIMVIRENACQSLSMFFGIDADAREMITERVDIEKYTCQDDHVSSHRLNQQQFQVTIPS